MVIGRKRMAACSFSRRKRKHAALLFLLLVGVGLLLASPSSAWWMPLARTIPTTTRRAPTHLASSSISKTKEEEWEEWKYIGQQQLQSHFPFPLDDWQCAAGGALALGHHVMVAAPTGAGKTVVGEMALRLSIVRRPPRRSSSSSSSSNHPKSSSSPVHAIYTTPLKALSNQKYLELAARFANVGLSTGDVSIQPNSNNGGKITVMTTEVYRNMAWRATNHSSLNAAATVVVLDEFHYMGLPGRGGVWEEAVIMSPTGTQLLGLSATLANADALVAWMSAVTGRRTVLVQVPNQARPVPLRYLFATKDGLYPLFTEKDAGPGAPLGLLGYRGDGVPPVAPRKKKKGFAAPSSNEKDATTRTAFPPGLQVNPVLRAAAARRLDRVQRALTRFQTRAVRENTDDEAGAPRRRRGGPQAYFKPKRNAKEELRERERLLKKEMRRAVPSLHILVRRLEQRDLLPAIFFLFSRHGCDDAARMVYRSLCGTGDVDLNEPPPGEDSDRSHPRRNSRSAKPRRAPAKGGLQQDAEGRLFRAALYEDTTVINDTVDWEGDTVHASASSVGKWDYYAQSGLLSRAQVREAAYRISVFNRDNAEIAFDEDLVEQFLFGIGSHHAGMLPAHKSFVEFLFRNQLLKVVFATETLAAGINMPARTTVICSMAKRVNGGSTMALLETSNLLQMAGRAGRRGMDTDGTCVLVATPFETHDDAVKILTDPILPISSQFRPSYALCVNLIARGNGALTVAQQLVSKSFAMWERRQAEEDTSDSVGEATEDLVDETVQASAHDSFIRTLADIFQSFVDQKSTKYDVQELCDVLNDVKILKKTSKAFVGMVKMREIETVTAAYLEKELALARIKSSASEESDGDLTRELLFDQVFTLTREIDTQRRRAAITEREVSVHPFTAIASIASEILAEGTVESSRLTLALRKARGESAPEMSLNTVTAEELSSYAKSAVVLQRKKRKLTKANVNEATNLNEVTEDAWDDFLSLVKTLLAYGCLSSDVALNNITNLENRTFELTPAGVNVGMLSFDNSLWALVAMGGAWDVTGASSELDALEEAMNQFDGTPTLESEEADTFDDPISQIPKPQLEAESLVALLKRMSPSELAGYVSSFISDDSRGGGSGSSIVESFQRLTPLQQLVVQKSLCSLERLVEVQKLFSVDEATRNCNFDISNCEVVTAWAAGCSWSEAVEMSGSPPGDLARILSRVLDAMRQFASLPYIPVRRQDFERGPQAKLVSCGIDQDVRRLCREASIAVNRYPVKDPLSFAVVEQGIEEDDSLVPDEAEVLQNESDELALNGNSSLPIGDQTIESPVER